MASEQGRQFGRYELQTRIGRGGMAETWRARLVGEAGVTKPVLIKKVLPEFANDEAFISMFISEARISATLSHGNVAQVFDFGRVGGEYFLAMEYVDGQPLHRILKRALRELSCLPMPMATYIAMEMCRGLHYAHTRTDDKGAPLGIVHRDISPDNVLISYEGQVKIVDFGIAKARSLRSFDTEPGVVKGKYLFFSPEQARGEEVDARTDVWATGVVLFNMLCGRLPLEGPEYAVMHQLALHQPLPRPRDVRPDLPARLDAILQKALAVRREERFESAHALGDALAGFLYTSAPRFSAMSVAYLLRELFRPEMTAEGRDARVPASFLEELSVWRAAPPLLRPTEPGTPSPTGEAQTLVRRPRELPSPQEPSSEEVHASKAAPPAEGFELAHVLVSVGILAALVLAWVVLDMVVFEEREVAAGSGGPTESPLRNTGPRPVPPGTATATPKNPAGAEEPAAPTSATWPVEAFQLEARQHLFRVSSGLAAPGALEPDVEWRIAETTPALEAAERGKPMPTLFYLLTGSGVSADAAVGIVSRRPETLRGASGLLLFTLGVPATPEDLPERLVTVTRANTEQARRFTVHPEWMTADVDRAFLLKGLVPEDTYRLTVEPVGEGAFTRGRERGRTRAVACVQQVTEEDLPQTPPSRAGRFLLAEGDEVRLDGMRGLYCGFVDDDPADNEGAMRVRIEKSRPLSSDRPGGTRAVTVKPATVQRSGTTAELASSPGAGAVVPAHGTVPGEENSPENLAAKAYARAQALLRSKQNEAALASARECLARMPNHADCLLLAGSAAARSSRFEEGARYYRRFLEVAPEDHPQASAVLRILQQYEAR